MWAGANQPASSRGSTQRAGWSMFTNGGGVVNIREPYWIAMTGAMPMPSDRTHTKVNARVFAQCPCGKNEGRARDSGGCSRQRFTDITTSRFTHRSLGGGGGVLLLQPSGGSRQEKPCQGAESSQAAHQKKRQEPFEAVLAGTRRIHRPPPAGTPLTTAATIAAREGDNAPSHRRLAAMPAAMELIATMAVDQAAS